MKFLKLIKFRRPARVEESNNSIVVENDDGGGAPRLQSEYVFVYRGGNKGRKHKAIPNNVIQATIHPSVRQINDFLFQDCSLLVRVSIPKTVKHIYQFAFKGCTALKILELHQGGLISIGRGAFEGCKSLVGAVETEEDSLLSYDNEDHQTFEEDGNSPVALKLPNTLESIGWFAFSGCTSLTNVHFQQGLKTLDRGAFLSSESLVQVHLPVGLKAIGAESFCWCESLTTVVVPATVEVIGSEAFAGCKSLVNLRLHEGLKTIGERAFAWCSSLMDVDLPETTEMIDFFAFGYCASLINVQIQKGLKSIGQCAFTSCSSLSAIALPSSLEELCLKAFSDCVSLRSVEFPNDSNINFDKNCFFGCRSLINVALPCSVSAMPTTVVFAGCDLLLDGGNEAHLSSYNRFSSLPVHEVCYHSTTNTIPGVIRALDSTNLIENMQDAFGMTPFHILSLSCNPSVQILQCLLNKYPLDTLEHKDKFNKTMMDYLLLNTSRKSIPLLQTVLERTIVDQICSRSCTNGNNKWRADLTMCLGALYHHESVESRRNHVNTCFLGTVGYCVRLELTSMMELALWKMRTKEKNKNPETNNNYREDSRFQCGSEVVIENVFGYLWDGERKSDTALSTFRIWSAGKN